MYLHIDASAEAGTLPTTSQSARTAIFNFDAQTVNRTMDTIIGTGQTSITFAIAQTTNQNRACYISKFISPELNQTSVAANTWRYNFATKASVVTSVDDWPCLDAPAGTQNITAYVWRPSNGTKVGNIFDSTVTGYYDVGNFRNNTTAEKAEDGTFTGSAVTTVVGDVIIVESWGSVYTTAATASTLSFFFDGGTETLVDGTTVADHASFLETPENLSFVTAATTTGRLYRSFTDTGFYPSTANIIF